MASGYINTGGYRMVPDDRVPGATQYIPEHRLVMEKALGRRLKADEVVHHHNEDKLDNRLSNLEVMTLAEHTIHHNKTRVRKRRAVTCCDEGEPHYARGLCYRHYQTLWSRGELPDTQAVSQCDPFVGGRRRDPSQHVADDMRDVPLH